MKIAFDGIGSDWGIVLDAKLPDGFPFDPATEDFDDAMKALVAELNRALGREAVTILPGDEGDEGDEESCTMANERERLEEAMEMYFGPKWYVELAGAQLLQQYAMAADVGHRDLVIRHMKNDAMNLAERMAMVCVSAGLVTDR